MRAAVATAMLCAMPMGGVLAAQAYLSLPAPQRLELPHQDWEGDQQPHTLSVVEWNRGGYRYWGWYGLNNGRGMGLVRSRDLVHWTKLEANPLWRNARWPSVVKIPEGGKEVLYLAVTRDYDTPQSRIVLARSEDGMHLTEIGDLVPPVKAQRNQNPNLFRDPVSGRYYLTFYRGNDEDSFDIVSKKAGQVRGLRGAPERVLMHTTQTVAAPNLMYVPGKGEGATKGAGIYYLATEIFPGRYGTDTANDWQVKVFASSAPDGDFEPVAGNPMQTGGRACLFQHIFDGKYYGFQSHIDHSNEQWEMEVLVAPL